MKEESVNIDHKEGPGSTQPGLGKAFVAILGSLKFAVILLFLITLACIVGTILPQGGDVARYVHANPGAENVINLLNALGFTHVFSASWFTGLLCLLSCCLVVCTSNRIKVASRVTGRARGRALGSVITHISLLFVLAGAIVRGVWGEKGVLEIREGEKKAHFAMGQISQELPFTVHLVSFETEMYNASESRKEHKIKEQLLLHWRDGHEGTVLPVEVDLEQVVERAKGPDGEIRVKIVRRVKDFVIDIKTKEIESRSDELKNPAILVNVLLGGGTNSQWLFARHPDFNMHVEGGHSKELPFEMHYDMRFQIPAGPRVKDWKSTLEIIDADKVVLKKTIEVNSPLSYKGYTLYQLGFRENEPEWTSLQVVRDPGVPLVYTGFLFMIIGLAMIFYIYPSAARMRKKVGKEQDDDKIV